MNKRETSLQDHLSDNLDKDNMSVDDTSVGTDSTDDDSFCTLFEELSDELYHPRAVNSPATWIRHNNQKMEQARRQAADRRVARGDLPTHSASLNPPLVYQSPTTPHTRSLRSCSGECYETSQRK